MPVHEAVHDQNVTQTARFTLDGRAIPAFQVRYYIGAQGPFTDMFDAEKYTPEAVHQAQLAHIHTLQSIGVPLPGPPVERIAQEPALVVGGGAPLPVPPRYKVPGE